MDIQKTIHLFISHATILVGRGADHITLHTSLPCPFTKEGDSTQQSLQLDFKATKGTGEVYVIENFGIKPIIFYDEKHEFYFGK
jgi:hypothetical protein